MDRLGRNRCFRLAAKHRHNAGLDATHRLLPLGAREALRTNRHRHCQWNSVWLKQRHGRRREWRWHGTDRGDGCHWRNRKYGSNGVDRRNRTYRCHGSDRDGKHGCHRSYRPDRSYRPYRSHRERRHGGNWSYRAYGGHWSNRPHRTNRSDRNDWFRRRRHNLLFASRYCLLRHNVFADRWRRPAQHDRVSGADDFPGRGPDSVDDCSSECSSRSWEFDCIHLARRSLKSGHHLYYFGSIGNNLQ